MDLTMGIAAMSTGMTGSDILTNINLSLMGKVLDTAETQGQMLEQMMDAAGTAMMPPSQHLLDVYA